MKTLERDLKRLARDIYKILGVRPTHEQDSQVVDALFMEWKRKEQQ